MFLLLLQIWLQLRNFWFETFLHLSHLLLLDILLLLQLNLYLLYIFLKPFLVYLKISHSILHFKKLILLFIKFGFKCALLLFKKSAFNLSLKLILLLLKLCFKYLLLLVKISLHDPEQSLGANITFFDFCEQKVQWNNLS